MVIFHSYVSLPEGICSVWRCLIHVLRNESNSLKFRWALAILNWIQTRSTFQRSCTHFRYSYEIYQVRWLSWLGHIHLYKRDSTLSRCSRQLLPDHIFCQRLLESLFSPQWLPHVSPYQTVKHPFVTKMGELNNAEVRFRHITTCPCQLYSSWRPGRWFVEAKAYQALEPLEPTTRGTVDDCRFHGFSVWFIETITIWLWLT